MRNISQYGLELIKHFEGFRSKMYLDSAGFPTIGYGTLIDTEEEERLMREEITEDQAEFLLSDDMFPIEVFITNNVNVDLTQNQFDSLCSFCYNLGVNRLRKSTLLKKINANPNDESIKEEFWKWCYAGGKMSEGLLVRRKAEAELYFKP